MSSVRNLERDAVELPTIRLFQEAAEPTGWEGHVSLRMFYENYYLPGIRHDVTPKSLAQDRYALNQWERFTQDRDIRQVGPDDLAELRDNALATISRRGTPITKTTVNAIWRELKPVFRYAEELGKIERCPQIGIRAKSRLCKSDQRIQRDTITADEIQRLWIAASHADYPQKGAIPAARLFRVMMVLFWSYGARKSQFIERLVWDEIDFENRLISFQAIKTTKLQGVPLTDLVIRHLRSIKTSSRRVFANFNAGGSYISHREESNEHGAVIRRELLPPDQRHWVPGYYQTWNQRICPAAGVVPEAGPDGLAASVRQDWGDAARPRITFQNFRQTMVTELNDRSQVQMVGNWVAAHYMPGVSAQSYDKPTERVKKAIEDRERELAPDCFHEEA